MICAIIQARLGSSRLPGKVLFEVDGRAMLSYMIERVSAARRIDRVVVATSDQSADDPIAELCAREGVHCFRGSLENVIDRYYQAARQVQCDVIVRLTGDCPLVDPKIIDAVVGVYLSGRYDFAANTVPPEGSTFPDGMDVEVFSFEALERAWREAEKPSEKEHVTFYFWKNPELFSTTRYDLPFELGDYRLTVDYREDFEVVRALIETLYPRNPAFSMIDVISQLNADPQLRQKNSHILPNQGWQPSLEQDRAAGFGGR